MTTNVINNSGAFNFPFTGVDMTRAINNVPLLWGAMTQRGLFPIEPIATTNIEIFIEDDLIYALPVGESRARNGSGKSLIFKVPPIIHYDTILAADIKNMVAIFERTKNPETFANQMAKRLQRLKKKFDLTGEIMRTGGIKGVVIDGAKNEIYDLHAAFGISLKTVYFDLSNANSDIKGACTRLRDIITNSLSDEVMTGISVECDTGFFEKLTQHPKVEKFWLQAQQALELANISQKRDDSGYRYREFLFNNILFRENPAIVPFKTGSEPLIAADTGHAYPEGTFDSHTMFAAPPDDLRQLDGQAMSEADTIYITDELMKHGAGIELKGQMHALPIWKRPKLLVKCLAGSGSSSAIAY